MNASLFERCPFPLLIVDGHDRLVCGNPAARKQGLSDAWRPAPPGAQLKLRDSEGRLKQFQLSRIPLPSERTLIVADDVTRERDLEAELALMRRTDTLGAFTAQISSELATLLTPIALLTDALQRRPTEETAALLSSAVSLANERVRALARFTDPPSSVERGVMPARALEELKSLLEVIVGARERLVLDVEPLEVWVPVERSRFEQVVIGLVAGASRGGGTVQVSAALVTLEGEAAKRFGCAAAGRHVAIAFTGSAETTSQPLVRQFALQRFLGELGAGSDERDAGRTLVLYLPCLEAPRRATPPSDTPAVTPSSAGNETVLVVDDDHNVREVIEIVLREQGYRVLGVATCRDALARAGVHVDLALVDVVLPDCNPRELADQLAGGARQRLLFMSGQTDHAIRALGVKTDERLLRKPFSSQELLKAVRRTLDTAVRAEA